MKKGDCPWCRRKNVRITCGVCHACYRRKIWKRPKVICKECGKKKVHQARGFCVRCYCYLFRLDYIKAWNRKKYHNIDPETYKEKTKECVICGFDKVVELHHLDNNHHNNSKENLVGLCPNHHKMYHNLKYQAEIEFGIKQNLLVQNVMLP